MNLTFIREKYLLDAFPFRIRVWKNNKVIKTLSSDKDDENSVINSVKKLGVDYDKVTVHDPKTMKQLKRYNNASQKTKLDKTNTKLSSPKKSSPQNLNKGKIDVEKIKRVNFTGYFTASFNGIQIKRKWERSIQNPGYIPTLQKATELMKKSITPYAKYSQFGDGWNIGLEVFGGARGFYVVLFYEWRPLSKYKPGDESEIVQKISKTLKFSNIHCSIETEERGTKKLF